MLLSTSPPSQGPWTTLPETCAVNQGWNFFLGGSRAPRPLNLPMILSPWADTVRIYPHSWWWSTSSHWLHDSTLRFLQLEDDLVALVARANGLRSQITCLYGRLEVPAEDQKAFLEEHADCRPVTVSKVSACSGKQPLSSKVAPSLCPKMVPHSNHTSLIVEVFSTCLLWTWIQYQTTDFISQIVNWTFVLACNSLSCFSMEIHLFVLTLSVLISVFCLSWKPSLLALRSWSDNIWVHSFRQSGNLNYICTLKCRAHQWNPKKKKLQKLPTEFLG